MSDRYWQDTNWIDEALEDALSWADSELEDWEWEDEFLHEFWDDFQEDEDE